MPALFPATLAEPGRVPALQPVRLVELTLKQLVAPPPRLLVDCGGRRLPHPLGVCRFVTQLLQLRRRGARLGLCNVHPGLRRYLHQLNLGALFHLTGQETPPWAAGSPACPSLI